MLKADKVEGRWLCVCDRYDCANAARLEALNRDGARKKLRRRGWDSNTRRQWMCPPCVEKWWL